MGGGGGGGRGRVKLTGMEEDITARESCAVAVWYRIC